MDHYRPCLLCPRRCGVDRAAGERGFCGETAELRLASASIHRGEEPPVTGKGGSGTVFVSGCGLGCVFCQNFQISRGGRISSQAQGRGVSAAEFAEICMALQERGAENINIVTGSHAAPAIVRGLEAARALGLRIPALWNSSGYERIEALELLGGAVDVYLPDLKTLDRAVAAEFFHAPDYPEYAAAAVEWMMDRRPLSRRGGEGGGFVSGVIVRHLILPGCLESTREVLRWFARHGRGRALISLMTQYTPIEGAAGKAPERFLNQAEYEIVLEWLNKYGIEDGFYQELAAGSGWLPDFRRGNPFSSELSLPVWHWRGGFVSRDAL